MSYELFAGSWAEQQHELPIRLYRGRYDDLADIFDKVAGAHYDWAQVFQSGAQELELVTEGRYTPQVGRVVWSHEPRGETA